MVATQTVRANLLTSSQSTRRPPSKEAAVILSSTSPHHKATCRRGRALRNHAAEFHDPSGHWQPGKHPAFFNTPSPARSSRRARTPPGERLAQVRPCRGSRWPPSARCAAPPGGCPSGCARPTACTRRRSGSASVQTSETSSGTRSPCSARNCCAATKNGASSMISAVGGVHPEQRLEARVKAVDALLPVRQVVGAGRNARAAASSSRKACSIAPGSGSRRIRRASSTMRRWPSADQLAGDRGHRPAPCPAPRRRSAARAAARTGRRPASAARRTTPAPPASRRPPPRHPPRFSPTSRAIRFTSILSSTMVLEAKRRCAPPPPARCRRSTM